MLFTINKISFIIITDGKRPDKFKRLIYSIINQNVPEFEIIISGRLSHYDLSFIQTLDNSNIHYVDSKKEADEGKLGQMRNRGCEKARYDLLIVSDDDMVFQDGFYQAISSYEVYFDVLCPRILNPDGTRFWDWSIKNSNEHRLIEYNEIHKDQYITGGMCIMKAKTFKQVRWNSDLGFYEGEDVDFSQRLHKEKMVIMFCPEATVIHDDHRYTQFRYNVSRYNLFRRIIMRLRQNFENCLRS